MPASGGPPDPAALAERLLALATPDDQIALLRSSDMLNGAGLASLLGVAGEMVGRNPSHATELARLCAAAADAGGAQEIAPRALYLNAQVHAMRGQLETALGLITSARDGYRSIGDEMAALGTGLGLMHVLNELARHQEALETGDDLLRALQGGRPDPLPEKESARLAAAAHVNRGACLEKLGRFEEALAAYEQAEAMFEPPDDLDSIAKVLTNRGVVLLNLGQGARALAAFESAAAIYTAAGDLRWQADALINAGDAHLLLGNYARSLDAFNEARRLLGSAEELAAEPVLLLDTAYAYLALNLFPEALAAYREAECLLQSAGMSHDRARALWGIGATLCAQARYDEAEKELAAAAELFAASGNEPLLTGVMLEQSALLAALGARDDAVDTARRALARVSGRHWPVQQVYSHLRLADLLLPDVSEVEPHLVEAQRIAHRLALPPLRYRLNQRLGHLRLLEGRDEAAQPLLEAAVEEIEQMRGSMAHEAVRTSFLSDKTAAHEDLVLLHLGRRSEAEVEQAFAIAERAKSRTLVDLVTGLIEARPAEAADADLAARIGELTADLNILYTELLTGTGGPERALSVPELQSRAGQIEREISLLRLQATSASTTGSPFETRLSPADIRARLPDDETLVAYHVIGDEIVAFVITHAGIRSVRQVGSASGAASLLHRLGSQWDRFQANRAFVERQMATLAQSTERLLAALYAELVAPLESVLGDTAGPPDDGPRKLAIVPHGSLHQVPFHALFDGEQHLLERFEIAYAPSATLWALSQDLSPRHTGCSLVLGVADAEIPAAADEARAVARHLAGARVHIDAEATRAALEAVPRCDVLHLACHGLFRADNPMFSALKLHDGWLTAGDVMQLDLHGALVTMSACESGRGQVIGGDEVLGLARAVLGAGAATLVVSLWLVNDETTAALMAHWYELLRGGVGRAAALRAAQLAIKKTHPHPYYWAPFILIGQR